MDYVKLAQLRNLAGTPNKKKYEVVDQMDINYSVAVKLIPSYAVQKTLSGYTPLHISVMKFDFDLTLELLTRGANVLKQGTFDKWTPLHLIFFNTKIEKRMIWEVSGTLKEQRLVEILLRAHVNTRNTFNPVSVEGVSHLHIACIFNHVKAVRFLTRQKVVNQATKPNSHWPGYTALHFAVRYSSIEAVKILIKSGANVHLKDATGMSSLQLMIDRLIYLKDSMTFGKPINRSLVKKKDILLYEAELKAEAETIENIIGFVLKTSLVEDVTLSNSTELTTFHAACVQKKTSILQDFLTRHIDVNLPIDSDSPFWPGWTPLHFAARSNVEVVKLLVCRGADLNIRNTAEESPLDFCLKKYVPDIIHSILSMSEELENVLFTDGSTKLLDVILLMNNCDKFNAFLQGIDNTNVCVSPDSPIWPGYSFLHLAIMMNEVPTRRLGDMGDSHEICYCFEDVSSIVANQALMFWGTLDECLSNGCSLTTKNADGLSPIHLAFYLQKSSVVTELIKSCEDDAVDPSGLSHFHIACALNCASALVTIKKFCSRGANVNSRVLSQFEWHNELLSEKEKPRLIRVQANSTPLHIAVIFKNEEVVKYLLENGADVSAKDALGLTPIHRSMTSTGSIGRLLLENAANLRDCVSDDGLSYLHVAAFANDDLSIRKLLRNEANVNVVFEAYATDDSLSDFAGNTPLHVAVKANSDRAVRELLRGGANIDADNPFDAYDTPLEHVAKNLSSNCVEYFVIELRRGNGEVFSSGITTLHFACSRFDHKWARQLLGMGADPSARVCDDEDYTGPWKGCTPLHLLIDRARTQREGPKYVLGMVELLLWHGADATIGDSRGWTPLLIAYDVLFDIFERERELDNASDDRVSWGSVVNILFESIKKYDVNPANNNGFTLFHLACMKNEVDIVQKFLDKGVNVNLATDPFGKYKGYTPLHVAFLSSSNEVARLLIKCGANVKAEDVDGNTPLHFAARWTSMKDLRLVQMLLRGGAYANAKNLIAQTPIDCHLKSKFLINQLFTFLHKHGSVVNVSRVVSDKGSIGLAMKHAFLNDGRSIFDTLVEICDLKNAIEDGFNAIHSIVSVTLSGEINMGTYLNCIEQMLNMGCELDKQDEEGNTALHQATYHQNTKAIKALLSLGADINIVNRRKSTPFTIACSVFMNLRNKRLEVSTTLKSMMALKDVIFHVFKMCFVGLYMNNFNQKLTDEISLSKLPSRHKWSEAFQEELAKMNSIQICESLALGDFMSELKAVATYPRILLWKRQVVDYYFSCTADVREAFPHLAGVLMLQYRKALARRSLIEQSKIVMHPLWLVALPDLCSEAILSYLNNDELKLLVEDTEDVSHPCKRLRLQ